MQPNAQQMLDIESTLQRLKGDRGFLHTLFRVFLDDLPKKINTLEKAFQDGDLETIQHAAHSLRGACATIGADRLRDASSLVEHVSAGSSPTQQTATLKQLKELAHELSVRLRQEIEG
ncbi:MAG: Hpt domain-containing protein [Proteobacteria bacterium]|nr:Hpt domain-containing protein [Pseudomonadota bacterium]